MRVRGARVSAVRARVRVLAVRWVAVAAVRGCELCARACESLFSVRLTPDYVADLF